MFRYLALTIFLLTCPSLAWAQSCPVIASEPNFPSQTGQAFGAIASQWTTYFGVKADANNGIFCNPQIIGALNLSGSNLSVSSLSSSGSITGMGGTLTGTAITGLPMPINPTDATTKGYVDATAHEPAAASTGLTTALPSNTYNNDMSGVGATLTATSNGVLTIDSYSPNTGDRLLIAGEGNPANNGLYVTTNPGSSIAPYVLTRVGDFNQASNILPGSIVFVWGGASNSGQYDLTTSGTITLGTTPLIFAKSAASSGALIPLQPAALATTAALPTNTYSNGTSGVGATLTATANAALTVDSVTVTSGERILVDEEAAPAHNGVYTVTTVGSGSVPYVLTRSTDFDTSAQLINDTYVFVSAGTVNAKTGWILNQTAIPTIGTTAINWQQFSGATSYTAGTGLTLVGSQFSIPSAGVTAGLLASGVAASNLGFTPLNKASNLSDLTSATTARTNLGLGSLAVLSTLPTPTPSILGGAFSFGQQSNQFLTALSTNGTFTAAQPSFANLSGSVVQAQLPSSASFGTLLAGSATANPIPVYDGNLLSVTGVINSGTLINNNGIGVFINDNLASVGPGSSQNAVLYYGVGIAEVNSAWIWGLNPVLADAGGISSAALSNEFDFNVGNAGTTVYGLLLQGASTVQPTGVHPAIEVAALDVQDGTPHISWSYGLSTLSGAAAVGAYFGEETAGSTTSASQPIQFAYGANLTYNMLVSSLGNLTLTPVSAPGAATGLNIQNNASSTNNTTSDILMTTLSGQGQFAEEERGSGVAQTVIFNSGSGGMNILPGSGGLLINSVGAVSCSANTVSLTTLVVSNGIVTHC